MTENSSVSDSPVVSAALPIELGPASRGVLVGGSFTSLLLGWIVLGNAFGISGGPALASAMTAVIGVLGGAVIAFSRDELGHKGWEQRLVDSLLALAWVTVLTSALNLAYGTGFGSTGNLLIQPRELAGLLAWCGLGTAAGSLIGSLGLRKVGEVKVFGKKPFAAVTSLTAGIANPNARFVTRVVLMSALAVVLGIALYVAILITLAILMIVAIIMLLTAGGSNKSRSEDEESSSSYRRPRKSSGGGWFASKCSSCGSLEHTTSDCPHGIFSSKCSSCGSTEHATSDCPHGIFSSKCNSCGSTDHATGDCPHGIFSSKCSGCGSLNHATGDCPHGIFSSKCSTCGSVDHATNDCPH